MANKRRNSVLKGDSMTLTAWLLRYHLSRFEQSNLSPAELLALWKADQSADSARRAAYHNDNSYRFRLAFQNELKTMKEAKP